MTPRPCHSLKTLMQEVDLHWSSPDGEPTFEYGDPDGLGVIREVTVMGSGLSDIEEALTETAKYDSRIETIEDHDDYVTVKMRNYKQWSSAPFGIGHYALAFASAREDLKEAEAKKTAKKAPAKKTAKKKASPSVD